MKTLILGAAAAALLHITPTVTLVERAQVVSRLLDGADPVTAREVHNSFVGNGIGVFFDNVVTAMSAACTTRPGGRPPTTCSRSTSASARIR